MSLKYYRAYVFSSRPMEGWIAYKNVFQLFPCPYKEAPTSNRCDFPLICEVLIDTEENPPVSILEGEHNSVLAVGYNGADLTKRMCNFLTAISGHRIRGGLDGGTEWGWHLPEVVTKENVSERSVVMARAYWYPELPEHLKIDRLSDMIGNVAPSYPHKTYYIDRPEETGKETLVFSDRTLDMLGLYFNVDAATRNKLDRIAKLIADGVALQRNGMESLSFLSVVSAIETLASDFFKDDAQVKYTCKQCKALEWSPYVCQCGKFTWGVSAKFREFLKEKVSRGSAKLYRKIYDRRSMIVHEGLLLLGNERGFLDGDNQRAKDSITHAEAVALARNAFANWLLTTPHRMKAPTVENGGRE